MFEQNIASKLLKGKTAETVGPSPQKDIADHQVVTVATHLGGHGADRDQNLRSLLKVQAIPEHLKKKNNLSRFERMKRFGRSLGR